MLNIAVLISGSGTNLQAVIDHIVSGAIDGRIVLVISNQENAYGLRRAQNAGIKTLVIKHQDFASRAEFDRELRLSLEQYNTELVVLAGFMRILTDEFVAAFAGRLLNIHPSLLPEFRGLNTHARALAAGNKIHGASVHFVVPELDAGPNIIQAEVPVLPNDTPETLAARVHIKEHIIYPQAVEWYAAGRLELKNALVYLDGKVLPKRGVVLGVGKS